MHAQPGASFVQLNCCATVCKLLLAGYAPMRCGALAAAVVTAMSAHARTADVQMVGCAALGNLAAAAHGDAAFDAAACVTAVVAAMRAHSTQPELLGNTVAALSALMQHPRGCTRAMELDARQLAVRAMRLVPPALQEHTARVIALLVQAAGAADAAVRMPAPEATPIAGDAVGARACARPGCGATGAGVHLMRCAGCYTVQYCGNFCQKAHWREHKPACRALRDARNAKNAA
jgi:hypothetical protein